MVVYRYGSPYLIHMSSPIMEAAFGRIHKSGRAASGGPLALVEVIMGDEMCIKYARMGISCLGLSDPVLRECLIIQEEG